MKLKRSHWAIILIVTLIIVVMAPSDNDSGVGKVPRAGSQRSSDATSSVPTADKPRTHEVGHVELDRLTKLELQNRNRNNVGDAFNTNSWYVAPPTPQKILPAQPIVQAPPPVVVETAPPLPFTYLGRYGDTPSRTIILSKGDRVYTVSVGDVIENTYQVEKFTTGMINLTYLPLHIEQHLPTGEAL